MLLIDCKVELRLKWTNHYVLVLAGGDNTNTINGNTIVTIKDTKLYVPVVTLSAKVNQDVLKILSKCSSKGSQRSVCWDEYKTKNDNIHFYESKFVGASRLFALLYSNQDVNDKKYKSRGNFTPTGILKRARHQVLSSMKKRYMTIQSIMIKMITFSRKCNGPINYGKLWSSKG